MVLWFEFRPSPLLFLFSLRGTFWHKCAEGVCTHRRYEIQSCDMSDSFFFPPLIMEYCSFQPRAPLLGGFSPFIFSSLCLLSTHTYIYTHTHTRSFSAVSSLEYFTAFTNSAALLFCEEEEQSCTHGYHRLPSLIPLFLSATSAVTLIIIQPKGDNSDRFFLLSLSLLLLLVVILCLLLLLLLLLLWYILVFWTSSFLFLRNCLFMIPGPLPRWV